MKAATNEKAIEQLEVSSDSPKSFEGFPIALVTAGLMALALSLIHI